MNAHAALPPTLRQRFLDAMSCAAATVNVVATDGPAGRAGVTVSAMASVSADGEAPTLLVCVHHLATAAAAILANGRFCVNILREDQSFISDTFAGRLPAPHGDRFACTGWAPMASGAPRVRDPLAAFDCRVHSAERIGTHHVFIGAVGEVFVAEAGSPLLFANRAYGAAARLAPRAAPAVRLRDRIRIGALPPFGPYLLPRLVAGLEARHGPVSLDLLEGDQRRLAQSLRAGDLDLALLCGGPDLGPDGDGGLATHPVADLTPHVLLAAGHPLAAAGRIALADLLAERMVLLDAAPGRDAVLALFAGTGTPCIGFRAQTMEMVRGLVAHGLGYALVATRPASAMSCDGQALVTRPLADAVPPRTLVLAHRADTPLSPAAQAFLAHAQATLCDDGA